MNVRTSPHIFCAEGFRRGDIQLEKNLKTTPGIFILPIATKERIHI